MSEAPDPAQQRETRQSAARAGMLDLTQGPVNSTLFKFALPTLGSNVLQSLNGSISAIYVGKFLGENAFAAAGIANMVMFLIFSTVFGLAMAATILVGQSMGRGDLAELRRTIGATSGMFAIASVVLGALGILLTDSLLRLLATPAEAFPLAVEFLWVVFPTLPIVFQVVLVQSALRGVGDAVTPLWSTVLNVVLSLVLNPLLILGWGPIPAMGLPGAALAGAIANLLCLAYMLWRIYRHDLPIRLRGPELRLLRPDWAHLRPILTMGVPMSLSMIIMSLSSLVMVGLINREGVDTVAAYNAATQLWNYIQMPAFAVSSAVSAMAAQNIGAGRWDRIGQLARTGVIANIALTGALIMVLVLAGELLLGLFLPLGSPAIGIGQHINLLIGWTFIPMGISMVLTSIVRANGAIFAPFLILVFSVIVVRMSVGFGLYGAWRADAIWWAFISSSTSSALLAALYYLKGNWRKLPGVPGSVAPEPLL